MSYADWEFYIDEFLLNRPPLIPQDLFPFSAEMATIFIDKHTFLRVRNKIREPLDPPPIGLDPRIPFDVSRATCALAEVIYIYGLAMGSSLEDIGGVLLPQGISLKQLQGKTSAELDELQDKKLQDVLSLFLAHTGLLYRGR